MNPSLPWRTGTAPDFGRDVHCLMGLPIDAVNMPRAVDAVRRAIRLGQPCFLSTPNLNFLIASLTDPDFRKSVIDSDITIADGMPLVWMSRLLGIPIPERVAGSGLVEELRQASEDGPLKVFFFGGPEGVAEAACHALNRQPCGLYCVGYDSPGFGSVADMSTPAIIERINNSGADFLVVALGAKKGQAWIQHNRSRLAVPVVSHLGAVINFVAGTVSRAPVWAQKSGLEWLWRIKEEPALWRRYWNDGMALGRLFATRVLPYAWLRWRHRPHPADLATATIAVEETPHGLTLRLGGAWGQENLQRLRDCLTRHFTADQDLHLDLKEVTHGDSAFIGLLMLLHGYQSRQGRTLRLSPVSNHLRRLLEYGCAGFLL